MHRSRDPVSLRALLASWLAAAVAMPATLTLAGAGQAIGAMLGGCRWIGLSLPPDLQVWALVNQPSLAFAHQPRALGYWLGALLAPLLMAALWIPFGPRPRTVAAELIALQLGWCAATVGLAWLPLLDPADGHLARWLALRRWPDDLVLVAPALATVAALVSALHLLALLSGARRTAGRLTRLTAVALHLGAPIACWAAVAGLLSRRWPLIPALALAPPLALALALAWVGMPRPFVHPLRPLTAASYVRLILAAALLCGLVAGTGRPLPDGRRAGVLWLAPTDTNNIRPWIEPLRVLWARTPPADQR